jgi:C-terminal processing protease CtpA/Prc
MINMDMIGRLKEGKLIVGGVGTASQWREVITSASQDIPSIKSSAGHSAKPASDAKSLNLTLNEDGFGPSDHSSFYAKKIPVLFFWTGTHEDYHKPSDTAEKINYEGEARILSLVSDVVRAVDRSEQRPAYLVAKSQSTGRAVGFNVSLGTIPNYSESTDGLKLDGVRDASPAAKAGLMAGDVIIKLAGRDIRNVYDYTYALGTMKAGTEYEVEARRGAEVVKLKIIPDARK